MKAPPTVGVCFIENSKKKKGFFLECKLKCTSSRVPNFHRPLNDTNTTNLTL